MRKIGITGAIGSGKTTVCRIFSLLGVPVYNADREAKKILMASPELHARLRTLFGHNVFSGELPDSAKLAALVFNNAEALNKLNEMLHPAVARGFENWVTDKNKDRYVIKEAAILFEAGADKGLDHVVVVTAPEELRKQRTQHRYTGSPGQFELRQQSQWSEKEKAARADFIIRNDDRELVIPQVMELHKTFSA